jgi:hypothetical protein
MRYLTVDTCAFSPELLEDHGILLNEYARIYLQHPDLQREELPGQLPFVRCRASELGFLEGCTLGQLAQRAREMGFSPCHPLAAVFLRLHLKDQHESRSTVLTGTHRAPEGSITVLSKPLSRADSFPKGLYLRNVSGQLWLRGYVCGEDFLWSADDQFALSRL